jgi:hypothetical protein
MVTRYCRIVAVVSCLVCLQTAPTEAQRQRVTSGTAATGQVDKSPRSQGPLIVDRAPGAFQTRLLSPANYVSPFAAYFARRSRPSSTNELQSYYQSSGRSRLLSAPEMFGDFRRAGPVLAIAPTTGVLPILQTEAPVAAGISGLRAAENNHALPADRVWFGYNYFSGAFDVLTDGRFGLTPTRRSQSLHRTTIAAEKLLDCGRTSIEFRMPFGSSNTVSGVGGAGGGIRPFGIDADSVGNLNVLLKRLLYADDSRAWSAGLGVEVPTGSSTVVTYDTTTTVLSPDAVHIVPFLAWTERSDRWFGNAFMQVDIETNGDRLQSTLAVAGSLVSAGTINQPVLFGADLGVGYWLRQPCECGSGGLALVAEAHYSAALGAQDRFAVAGPLMAVSVNTPVSASYEVINLTSGLEWSIGNGWSLRSAVVVPADTERVFDTEFLIQINRSI